MEVQEIFEWLVDGAPGAATSQDVVAELGRRIRAAGIPLDRLGAWVRTLHPSIMGRAFRWEPDTPVTISEASYAMLRSPIFLNSPVAAVFQSGKAQRWRIADPSERAFPTFTELVEQGFTDYYGVPLQFLDGQVNAATYVTKRKEGFDAEHLAALDRISRPLSRLAEILALRRTAVNFLNTYVGRNAGEKIISGKILRGDTDTIRAVIWFSDLRGFTALASTVEPAVLIGVLNDLFDCQVPAIEARGGEVLKFMGDGLLAIFPIGDASETAKLCDTALEAADEAFTAVETLNKENAKSGKPSIRFGLALHVGDVAYGNIGGAGRLDFTCIGPAVNVASRIEGLTAKLERPVLASAEFARRTTRKLESAGSFELKGVATPEEVFFAGDNPKLARWA
jgi:adenylate cyclase